MPIYLIVPLTEDSSKLDAQVVAKVPDATNRHQLQHKRGWLVHFPGTTIELSVAVGIANPDRNIPSQTDAALVVPVPSYYGRGPTDMWEWLFTRMDK